MEQEQGPVQERWRAFERWLHHLSVGSMLLLSFGGTAIIGSICLQMPGVLHPGVTQSPLDALFMAVSALCVTGLTVLDIGSAYTPLGQLVILVLIQLGGIGIITMGRLIFLRHRQMRDPITRAVVAETYGILPHLRPTSVLWQAMIYTGVCETIGVLLLAPVFVGHFGWGPGFWAAIFHSVSAFCNAGFGLWRDSLAGFRGDVWVNGVIMALVVAGGLGFLVVSDLVRWIHRRLRRLPVRISLHSKVVLTTTGLLLVGGTLSIWLLSRFNQQLTGQATLLSSGFLATSARTAGFSTVNTALWSNPTLLIVILLMIVGGSPGSAAGGVKTTTLATLFAVVLSRSRNRPGVELFRRQLSNEVVAKALVTLAGMLVAIVLGVILLEVVEVGMQSHAVLLQHHVFDYLFEVVSALCTVGLSTGVTTTLSPTGRLIITVCMFLGRVGPLLVASSLIGHRKRVALSYANEDLMVG